MKSGTRWILLCLAIGFVVGWALRESESPGESRLKRLDERRVENARAIHSGVQEFHVQNGRLPATLEELSATLFLDAEELCFDPASGVPYEYSPGEDGHYRLCITFDRESELPKRPLAQDLSWRHGSGRHCFQLHVQREDALQPDPALVQ